MKPWWSTMASSPRARPMISTSSTPRSWRRSARARSATRITTSWRSSSGSVETLKSYLLSLELGEDAVGPGKVRRADGDEDRALALEQGLDPVRPGDVAAEDHAVIEAGICGFDRGDIVRGDGVDIACEPAGDHLVFFRPYTLAGAEGHAKIRQLGLLAHAGDEGDLIIRALEALRSDAAVCEHPSQHGVCAGGAFVAGVRHGRHRDAEGCEPGLEPVEAVRGKPGSAGFLVEEFPLRRRK